jgi:hypothetical protein
VWVLEVNESPDLSHSTSTTAALVPQLLRDMTRVVIDAERLVRDGDGAGAKSWSKKAREKLDTGRFELRLPAPLNCSSGLLNCSSTAQLLFLLNCSSELLNCSSTALPCAPELLFSTAQLLFNCSCLNCSTAVQLLLPEGMNWSCRRFELLFPARRHNECISQENAQPAQVQKSPPLLY